MALPHWIQAFVALATIVVCERARRRVLHVVRYDTRLDAALRDGTDPANVAELAPGSVAGEVALAQLEAQDDGADLGLALDQARKALSHRLTSELRTLRVLGRVTAMVGGLVAVGYYLKLHTFPRGLDALVPGLLERRTADDATLAIALGLGTGLLTMVTRLALVPHAREAVQRTRTLCDRLERAADQAEGEGVPDPSPTEDPRGT
ncbi:MAG: hypothetical protein H6721_29675 [Sandaracinus sp.]|nr:hypothetical protein [Sandaracinus sp.]MCB9612591.1 hypothetical protein [Sandaracinus sp.]MCB9623397.1 hypothetical protein [Sandaracinus sp.]MCB9636302.1 hypothetical protein [Sandaracinus sp.]